MNHNHHQGIDLKHSSSEGSWVSQISSTAPPIIRNSETPIDKTKTSALNLETKYGWFPHCHLKAHLCTSHKVGGPDSSNKHPPDAEVMKNSHLKWNNVPILFD